MSKERQRARAARAADVAERRAAAEKQLARRVKADARRAALPKVPQREPVYRFRRFSRLPWRLKAALALFWLTAVVLVLVLVPTWSGRLGMIVVATAAVPMIVVIVRDPSRRTR